MEWKQWRFSAARAVRGSRHCSDDSEDEARLEEHLRAEAARVEEILTPPFGDVFDPEELVDMVRSGASRDRVALIGRSSAVA